MASIKGQNLRVFVDGKPNALATNCTVNITMNTEDASTKDTTGSAATPEVTGASWNITFEQLYKSTDAAAQTFTTLKAIIASMQAKAVVFDKAAGADNRVQQTAAYKMTGNAYLSQLTLTATNRENVTISGTLTGTGPLTKASNA
jgi:hypothetical protein